MKFETFNTKLHCLASYVQKLQKSPVLLRSDGIRQGLLICCLNPCILKLSRVRDCAAEARPADETAEAEQGQRSAFCKRATARAAKTGHRNHVMPLCGMTERGAKKRPLSRALGEVSPKFQDCIKFL